MNFPNKNELQALYQNWSTPILMNAVGKRHEEYTKEAIAVMLNELARRGIERKRQPSSKKVIPVLLPSDSERKQRLADHTASQGIPIVNDWEIRPPPPED